MQDEKRERWIQLCELAAKEQDKKKLMEYIAEMSRILEEKQGPRSAQDNPQSSSKAG